MMGSVSLRFFLALISVASASIALAIQPFPLSDVSLDDDSIQAEALKLNTDYLMMIPTDSLMWTFRKNVGMEPPGKPLGGWENPACEVRGSILGHYLTAMALAYKHKGICPSPDLNFHTNQFKIRWSWASVSHSDGFKTSIAFSSVLLSWYFLPRVDFSCRKCNCEREIRCLGHGAEKGPRSFGRLSVSLPHWTFWSVGKAGGGLGSILCGNFNAWVFLLLAQPLQLEINKLLSFVYCKTKLEDSQWLKDFCWVMHVQKVQDVSHARNLLSTHIPVWILNVSKPHWQI